MNIIPNKYKVTLPSQEDLPEAERLQFIFNPLSCKDYSAFMDAYYSLDTMTEFDSVLDTTAEIITRHLDHIRQGEAALDMDNLAANPLEVTPEDLLNMLEHAQLMELLGRMHQMEIIPAIAKKKYKWPSRCVMESLPHTAAAAKDAPEPSGHTMSQSSLVQDAPGVDAVTVSMDGGS